MRNIESSLTLLYNPRLSTSNFMYMYTCACWGGGGGLFSPLEAGGVAEVPAPICGIQG